MSAKDLIGSNTRDLALLNDPSFEITEEFAQRMAELATNRSNEAKMFLDSENENDWCVAMKLYKSASQIYCTLAERYNKCFFPIAAESKAELAYAQMCVADLDETEETYKEAVQMFRQLVAEQPEEYLPRLADCLDTLAILCSSHRDKSIEEGLLHEWMDVCHKMEQIDWAMYAPRSIEAYGRLAFNHTMQGRYSEAEKEYKSLIKMLEDGYSKALNIPELSMSEAWSDMGYMYKRSGHVDEAIKCLEESVAVLKKIGREPRRLAYAQDQLAQCYQRQGRLQDAISTEIEAIRNEPDCADWYDTLGHLYYLNGSRYDAVKLYQKVMEMEPLHLDLGPSNLHEDIYGSDTYVSLREFVQYHLDEIRNFAPKPYYWKNDKDGQPYPSLEKACTSNPDFAEAVSGIDEDLTPDKVRSYFSKNMYKGYVALMLLLGYHKNPDCIKLYPKYRRFLSNASMYKIEVQEKLQNVRNLIRKGNEEEAFCSLHGYYPIGSTVKHKGQNDVGVLAWEILPYLCYELERDKQLPYYDDVMAKVHCALIADKNIEKAKQMYFSYPEGHKWSKMKEIYFDYHKMILRVANEFGLDDIHRLQQVLRGTCEGEYYEYFNTRSIAGNLVKNVINHK